MHACNILCACDGEVVLRPSKSLLQLDTAVALQIITARDACICYLVATLVEENPLA